MSAVAAARRADPRPIVAEAGGRHVLLGARCRSCGHALAWRTAVCTRCGGPLEDARFGPDGRIWAVTVVHVAPAPGRPVPYVLAYIDLDRGPRVLVELDGPAAVDARARLTGLTEAGNPAAECVR